MPNYELLSGTQYRVNARDTDEAHAKLVAYWQGLDCPCGRPQWAYDHAREITERGENPKDYLCECVEAGEADTVLQFTHADSHPEK
jgi:hypothetical protein